MARILVIDDNDTMREGMAVTLKKAGHEVLAFRSGAEGVAAFTDGKSVKKFVYVPGRIVNLVVG